MAGLYPDVPGHRMAWDRDGTVAFAVKSTTGEIENWDATRRTLMNNETTPQSFPEIASSNNNGDAQHAVLIFPELRDITGYWFDASTDVTAGVSPSSTGAFQWSPNTTNGLDGTWNTVFSNWLSAGALGAGVGGYYNGDGSFSGKDGMRNQIRAVTGANGAKGVRWTTSHNAGLQVRHVHLFGQPSTGQVLHRLLPWHPTLSQMTGPAHFDWADVPQSTTATKQFRIKNDSPSMTANSIAISDEALTNASPSVPPQFEYSSDGSSFSQSINIGALAPGAVSPVLYVRRLTPNDAALGLWWLRTVALPGSWT